MMYLANTSVPRMEDAQQDMQDLLDLEEHLGHAFRHLQEEAVLQLLLGAEIVTR